MSVSTKYLFTLKIESQTIIPAKTALGTRQYTPFTGSFSGPGGDGKILHGTDSFLMCNAPYSELYLLTHPKTLVDGITNVRCAVLHNGDDPEKDAIYMEYDGIFSATWATWMKIGIAQKMGLPLPKPNTYYWRTCPRFETGSERWDHLNHCVAVGKAQFAREAVPPAEGEDPDSAPTYKYVILDEIYLVS